MENISRKQELHLKTLRNYKYTRLTIYSITPSCFPCDVIFSRNLKYLITNDFIIMYVYLLQKFVSMVSDIRTETNPFYKNF